MDKAGAIFALLTVFAVMLGSWFFAGVHSSMTAEEVEYNLLYKPGKNIEVREYGEMTVISTSSDDQGSAFSILASYISGKNAEKRKIDMISPVVTTKNGDIINMSFILPGNYDTSNAPASDNPEISIHTLPARKVAVIRFSGYAKEDIVEEKYLELSSQLSTGDIVTKGDYFLMLYNPPWVPPALMRNEVAIEVE
ncbi:MAG: heme-binding protein [Methanolobus sp.]